MYVLSRARLCAAFACVLTLAFSAAAPAADERAASTEQLRQLAAHIYTATRGTEQAHAAHHLLSERDVRVASDARHEFDALSRTATIHGFAADATFARKAAEVGKLLANLERAQKAAPDAIVPVLIPRAPAEDHIAHSHLTARNGANCASALTIGAGYAIETTLAGAGQDGSALWLRIAPKTNGFYRLDTTALPLDTEIALFGSTCPASDAEAVAHDDDSFGLAAAVTIDARKDLGLRYARIRNLGAAGSVLAEVQTAAAITGRIIDERNGQPLVTSVQTVTTEGYSDVTGYSGDDGFYLFSTNPGSYYVLAGGQYFYPNGGYVPELYPDIPCVTFFGLGDCSLDAADLLTLVVGQEISGIDFALNIGGRISGVVRERDTGAPLAGAQAAIFDANGNYVSYGPTTDAAGRYTIEGLLTGSYYVQASMPGHGIQRWDHFDCGGPLQTDCQVLDGNPLAVTRNQLSSGIDFDLPLEARIHGVASTAGAPDVPILFWQFTVYDLDGNFAAAGSSYGTSDLYSDPLPPGSYRVVASASGYFGQIWNGIDCPVDCFTQLASGTPLTVARGEQGEVSFALRPIPIVSGTVTDAASHQPLPYINVNLVPVDFPSGSGNATTTDAAGHYVLAGTPPGDYYVFAESGAYRGTLYPDVPCSDYTWSSCDLSSAIPVTIAYGAPDSTGIDIAMPVNGSISGHVLMRTPAGMTLPPLVPGFESVAIYRTSGAYVASSSITAAGDYTVIGIPAGTYYASASGSGLAQLWQGIDCTFGSACDPLTGSPIVIGQSENLGGIDFDPVPVGYVFGHVTDNDGAPVAGVGIDLWNTTDSMHCGVGVTNVDGYYAASDTLATCYNGHRVSTDAESAAYEDEVFNGIPCPAGSVYLDLCSLDGGTVLPIPTTPEFAIANFVLGPRPDEVFANGFDP